MTVEQLSQIIANAPESIVVDTEHLPDCQPALANLLGVAIAWAGFDGVYVPINHWVDVPSRELVPLVESSLIERLGLLLTSRKLSGWNIEHDREWIDACFNAATTWEIDGRILWYLSDKEQTERGYGLKKAQKTILGWAEAGDAELEAQVRGRGGRLDRGQHYLSDLDTLARYAVSDVRSTQLIIEKLRTGEDWLEEHHNRNRDYAALLAQATRRGVVVDEMQLYKAKQHYELAIGQSEADIRSVCSGAISALEQDALSARSAKFKSERGRVKFVSEPSRHPRFNPRSAAQRAQLLHDRIGLPVVGYTETGKRKSDKASIAALDHPSAKAFVELSKNEKLRTFAEQYFEHTRNGLIHFPHDTCATVSERLGGYAPYDLNMPFSSEPIMQAFRLRPGCVGVHMDLVSIEPCLIAGFSGDETMLKVYRDGLGDIYLDLCLELFPLEEADHYEAKIAELIRSFHREYRTDAPPSGRVKDTYQRIRKVAKIIQLAVGYTGTRFTVAKNLTLAGFPTSVEKAQTHVERYWQKFQKVAELAARLKSLADQRGYIIGLFGRRLFIPKRQTKDALNRFGQHGGHAILREIVFEIGRISTERGLRMWPVLPDVHDATSWEVEGSYADGRSVFEEAIRRVDAGLALPVSVRGEIKQFHTFYGLKNKEE